MYKTKYWIAGINSENDVEVKSYLEARFKFGKEIAPKDIVGILNRIDNVGVERVESLNSYLEEKGFFQVISKNPRKYYDETRTKQIKIFNHLFAAGFDLNVCAKGEFSRKEMCDLDGLNHFILTGEIK